MSRFFVLSSPILLGFALSSPVWAQTEEPGSPGSGVNPSAPPSSAPEAENSPVPEPGAEVSETAESAPEPMAPNEGDSQESGGIEESGEKSTPPPAETAPEAQEEKPSQISGGKVEPPYDGPGTLLDGDGEKMHIGGYGGLSVHGTSIHKTGGLLIGGEGALLLDHRLALGFAGYGLANEVRGPDFANGDESILGFGYGGAILRYHLVSKRSPVSASLGTLVGAGGLTLIQKTTSEDFEYEYDYEADSAASVFFIAEPGVQVNLHVTRWMRFGLNGGYRFVRGPSLRGISDGDLEGVTAGGHAQFGWF